MKKVSPGTAGAATLWLVAAGLLTLDAFTAGGMTEFGRWGLFASAAAATATVCHALGRCRRVILEVLTWERWMMQEHEREREAPTNVRKIR